MSRHTEDERRAAAADIAFRHQALKINGGIYARRHGPGLMPVLAGGGAIATRYVGQILWLGSEQEWRLQDARRLAELADEIGRFGAVRPGVAETCQWHADRLRELVRQHAVLARIEAERCLTPAWPAGRERLAGASRRGAWTRLKTRGLGA
jgi:hypothetical protein